MAVLWGSDAKWKIELGEHPHEANSLKLDISKARSRLNWHPVLRLDATLKLIVDWFSLFSAGADMRQFTLSQIHAYQALTKPE
jgi:CDP-glucose 4,6-dehydratase